MESTAAATSRVELQARLDALRATKAGCVRVYRGQYEDFGSMVPSGLRNRHLDRLLLQQQTFSIAQGLTAASESPPDEVQLWILGVRAIAQHYGPGSPLLDVTTSVDVALWFALHDATSHQLDAILGARGPLDPDRDRVARLSTVGFNPSNSVGYLYVFDVPVWEQSRLPARGELVDLASAPTVFAESPRIRAQSACLIAADLGSSDTDDLADLLASPPIPVAAPMAGSHYREMSLSTLFPPPEEDAWYAQLLATPLVNRYDQASGRLRLAQAIPVTLYGEDPTTLRGLSERLIAVTPYELWPYLRDDAPSEGWLPNRFSLPKDLTAIILPLPANKLMPPLGEAWNHGVAVADVPDVARVVDPDGSPSGAAGLTRVFVEFSPLELDDWRNVETRANDHTTYVRGAYLDRSAGFELWVVTQSFPSCRLTIAGPYPFVYDRASRRLALRGSEGDVPASAAPIVAKTLLTIITLLRELSSVPVPCPFASFDVPELTGVAALAVRLQSEMALLDAGDGQYVMYDPERRRPATTTSPNRYVTVTGAASWEDTDPPDARALPSTP